MSYAIIRNAKYKKENLAGLYKHNERKNTNYSNKDINKNNSIKNYSIKTCNTTYNNAIKILQQENNLQGRIIKTTNVACELIITSDKEREKIKQQREEFYKDSKIQTDNITVEIKKASEALYNERTIGYVEAKVTVEGKRNDDSFTNKYDLVLLMDYQEDVASVYEVVDIKTE